MNTKRRTALLCGLAAFAWAHVAGQNQVTAKLASASSSTTALLDSAFYFGSWNPTLNTWGYTVKSVLSYNSYDKENGNVLYNVTTAGTQPVGRDVNYQFDSQQNCLEKIYETFFNQHWSLSSKEQMTYDAANHQLTHLYLNYTGGAWENERQEIFTYTGNNLTTYTMQLWDIGTTTWKNRSRESYSYNTSDQKIGQLKAKWNAGAWVDTTRETNYTYSGADLLGYEIELWDVPSQSFKPNDRYTYSYDVNHHLQNILIEKWDASANTWKNDAKADYTTDANGNTSSFLARYWNASSNTWVNEYKSLFYYRNSVTGIGESERNNRSLVASPNPASSFVEINGANGPANARISDLAGNIIISERLEEASAARINIGTLAPGLYLLDVTTETGHFNNKIIKQ